MEQLSRKIRRQIITVTTLVIEKQNRITLICAENPTDGVIQSEKTLRNTVTSRTEKEKEIRLSFQIGE